MIYSLRGKLIYTDAKTAVIECGGVGYQCLATHVTLAQLPKVGEEAFLYTYMVVRDDAVELYGFYDMQELEFFKMIISVNGVGPKIGISVLSDFTPDQIALFITMGDAKSLSKANGIGAKTAQRIVLELKDKVSKSAADVSMTDMGFAGLKPTGNAQEAVEALIAIGFTEGEASKTVARIDPQLSVEDIVKAALKAITN